MHPSLCTCPPRPQRWLMPVVANLNHTSLNFQMNTSLPWRACCCWVWVHDGKSSFLLCESEQHDSKVNPTLTQTGHQHHLLIKLNQGEAWRVRLMRRAFWFWWHLRMQIFWLRASHLWMIFSGCAVNVPWVRLSSFYWLFSFLVGRCFIFVPSYLWPPKGDGSQREQSYLRGQQSACICGLAVGGGGGVGWGGMGSRWRWFRPISTTEGGTEDGHGPPSPINGIQGDALSSHQHHPFLTPNPSPPPHTTSSSSLTPNHTILDVESIIWILAVLEMRPDSHRI